MKILPDTNIFIYGLKGDMPYAQFLHDWITNNQLVFSPIVIAEFLIGALAEETNIINKLLNHFPVHPIDVATAKLAADIRRESLSKKTKLHLPDCFLAATCKQHHLVLATLNPTDFPPNIPTFNFRK